MTTSQENREQLMTQIIAGRLSRRDVLRRGVALGLSAPVVAALLAACGDEETTEDDASAQPTSSTAPRMSSPLPTAPASDSTEEIDDATPATGDDSGRTRGEGDLLRILYWQAPTILNPHFSQGTKDSAASSLVLEPLLDVDVNGVLVPVLAAEVPSLENGGLSADGMSVTYNLLQDVVWSDGEPFTAEDVEFTWRYVTDETAATTTIASYLVIESVEVIDNHTVTLNFIEPTPGWYSPFTTAFGGQVLPKHLLENEMGDQARNSDFNLQPIGTGPYKVVEFRPGDAVVYDINATYREASKPYFKTVNFKGGGDATSAARAALQTGEIDWAWNLQVEAEILLDLDEGDVGTLIITPSPSVERLLVNFADPNQDVGGARSEPSTEHPYLSDKLVRQAFALAVDRDTVSQQLYGPSGEPTANLLVAPPQFASENTAYEFDVDAAISMLEEDGWMLNGAIRSKEGVELRTLYQTSINPVRLKTQQIIKQAWERMGAVVELKSIDAAVFFSSAAGNPDTASHFYADFEMYTNGPSVPYPIDYMLAWRSLEPEIDLAQQSNQWAGPNYCRWVNEEYNELFEQARTELDPDRQAELFIGMNDLIVNEIASIGIVHRADVVGASSQLRGYEPSPWTTDVRDIANWYMEE